MDPCPFVRILVGDLVLKSAAEPRLSTPSSSSSSSTSSSYFCKIKLKGFPEQFSVIGGGESGNRSVAACFSLNRAQIDGFADKQPRLKILVYSGKSPVGACGLAGGKVVGKVYVPLDLRISETRPCVFQQGWIPIGDRRRTNRVSSSTEPPSPQLHLIVRAEPDPRFVFLFDGEPECSPQVFQVQGNVKQPVFTCKFGFRSNSDLKNSSISESRGSRNWMILRKKTKDNTSKERKGWSITIHDLSGSPVAVASMVTPFVASPGSDRVSRANPGAWLILRPGEGTWKPWGRLEAWREKSDSVGYKFDLLSESSSAAAATLASDAVSAAAGGKFTIDSTTSSSSSSSPMHSPHSSLDFGSGSRPGSRPGSGSGSDFGFGISCPLASRGFVMSSTVEGAGKSSRPEVEVGVQHVSCSEDAAAFVAIAAAMNLSMDACRLFSQKLPKELRN